MNLRDCKSGAVNGDVIFYECMPPDGTDGINVIDISREIQRYMSDNVSAFVRYVTAYIEKNGSDVRTANSMLFEFNRWPAHGNKAFELLALKKVIAGLDNRALTLVFPDGFDIGLIKTFFYNDFHFKPRLLWKLKFILRLLFYFCAFLPMVRLKSLLQGSVKRGDLLFHSYIVVDNNSRRGFKVDPYFSELIEALKKKGISVNRFATFGGISIRSLLTAVWRLDASEFIFPEQVLRLREIWDSFRLCYSVKNADDLGTFQFDGIDLTRYMRALSKYLALCCLNFRFDLMRKYIRKVKHPYKVLLIQHENVYYQRRLVEEAKRSLPQAVCLTYQFGVAANVDIPNQHYIFTERYQPHFIFASGRYFSDYMRERLGYQAAKIKTGYSLHIPQGIKYKRSDIPVLCVYVSDIHDESVALKAYIKNLLVSSTINFHVGMRFHPYCSPATIALFKEIDYFEYEDAEDSLFRADCFLSIGTSTIIFSAAMTKKPVYLLGMPNFQRFFDAYSLDNVKYISMDEPITVDFFSDQEYINEDVGVSIEETCEEIIKFCLPDIGN